ncbi:hypothetical protein [Lacibacter sediminis]|uniref:Uncharacterized protein n=1 Tax=Lacibacter sediminis TaxID=2760713 RepID=A0A7G5XBH9_9BACT|nr:hypothetical protein [Lacibacter sediminis]QNA42832.1 hypothetical protein H4075_12070 [Lacibacter sediminis]
MEHNFNPNKGDYKYILEEEQRKETGEAPTAPASSNQSLSARFWNWLLVFFLKRSKRTDQIKITFPVLFEFFC